VVARTPNAVVLTDCSGPERSGRVSLQVVRIDMHVDVIGLRQDRTSPWRVDAP